MPPVLAQVSYEPIKAVRVLSSQGATPQHVRQAENAGETFKMGTPVKLDANGHITACTFAAPETVYGVASEAGHNLTTDNTAQDLNDGTVPNQTSAVVTPIGAMIRDGKCGVYAANGQTVFSIALKATQVFTEAMVGVTYGIFKDATSGFWYLDNTDTIGDNAVATVVGNDSAAPNTSAGGARVFFIFKASLRAFN